MFRLAMAHHFNFNKIKLVHPVAHFSATSSHHDVPWAIYIVPVSKLRRNVPRNGRSSCRPKTCEYLIRFLLFTQKRLCVVFKTIYKKRFFIIHEDV